MSGPLPINEIFETIQGEAYYTGTPAVFVRLQGCGVGCPWCDTKHTWSMSGRNRSLDEIVAKSGDSDEYAYAEVDELVKVITSFNAKHVVLTGGEPCLYDLSELTTKLLLHKRTVQIETSGTAPVRVAYWAWVTVSPKVDMPGNLSLLPQALARADEIKMPVGKMADIDKLRAVMDRVKDARQKHDRDVINGGPTVWLQPLSQSPKATELCVEMATLNGWKLSVQTHKYLGVR